ncbi:MAG TPA: DUF805 domain-containing protein [Caulobacteraceae bacterium]|jgi:uncharacterized membrane protein YhaH (DUF805 family)|nr:DUF805 domain-containing protein [Caulobacteraceae bacterium]
MNGGPINWRDLFASPAGRCPRTPFWIAATTLMLLLAIYEAIAFPTLKLLSFWFVYPALLASGACVISKRLHDRGRSGWWAALVLLAVMLVWRTPNGGRFLLALPVLFWSLVELGLLPGEQGANRFGPSPLASIAT